MNDYHELWSCDTCRNIRTWGTRPGAGSKPVRGVYTFESGAFIGCKKCGRDTKHTFSGTRPVVDVDYVRELTIQ